MKQSKTTLKELTAMYRAVLRHGILCNAIALGLLVAPANATYITVSEQESLANVDWTIPAQSQNSDYYTSGDANGLIAVLVDNDAVFSGNATNIAATYSAPQGGYSKSPLAVWIKNGQTATFGADSTNISISGQGASSKWGKALEIGFNGNPGATKALFNGDGDVVLSSDWDNYTAQTLTIRNNATAEFRNTGDVTINAASNFGSTGITQHGNLDVDIGGDFSITAGRNTDDVLSTNAVALQMEKSGAQSTIKANRVNLTSLGSGRDYNGTTASDGTMVVEMEEDVSVNIDANELNITANSTAPTATDGKHRLSTGIFFVKEGNTGNQLFQTSERTDTTIDITNANNEAYGIFMADQVDGTSSNAEFGGDLTINTTGASVSKGAIVGRNSTLDVDGNLTINAVATNAETGTATGIEVANGGIADLNVADINVTGATGQGIINRGTFTANSLSVSGANVAGNGAAVYNEGTLTLSSATFGGDTAALGNSATTGGAIYNTGTATIGGTFANNSAVSGGAIRNNGTLTISEGSEFTNNSAPVAGGAIYNNGTLNINDGVKFTGNTSYYENLVNGNNEMGGAIYSEGNTTTQRLITIGDNVEFKNNKAYSGGAIYLFGGNDVTIGDNLLIEGNMNNEHGSDNIGGTGGIDIIVGYSNDGNNFNANGVVDLEIGDNATFKGNKGKLGSALRIEDQYTTGGTHSTVTIGKNAKFEDNIGTAIYLRDGNNYGTTLSFDEGAQFINNDARNYGTGYAGAIDNNKARLTLNGATFTGNKGKRAGAIYNRGSSTLDLTNVTFTENNGSTYAGAVHNAGTATITNGVFTNNIGAGGAIRNSGTLTLVGTNTFTGNATSDDAPIDIYNTGTLNIGGNASLAAGIQGAGTVNITDGLTETSNIIGQTVNVNGGELHLATTVPNGLNVYGSTITVGTGSTINTIDNLINNYTASIRLADDAIIKGDIDYLNGTADTYAAADGADSVIYKIGNALNVAKGDEKTIQVVDGAVTVNKDAEFAWFNGNSGLTLNSSGTNDGSIKVTGLDGGITTAVDYTETAIDQEIAYVLTESETFNGDDNVIQNAVFAITGNGTNEGDHTLSLQKDLIVDSDSSLTITDAKLVDAGSGTGVITNRSGAVLSIFNSKIDVNINNAGEMYSDPTTYSATVTNTGTAEFDNDIFESTAVLNNSGTANLVNGVTFNSGAKIMGAGVTNLVNGTTHFNNTSSQNTLNLASGAQFDGMLIGGTLNTQNNSIDTITDGSVSDADLYVDADLSGATGAIDNFANSTDSVIKNINITSHKYGTNGSYSLNVGGASLAGDLTFSGGANYYTKVVKDGDNIVFSDKLMNTSGMHNQLGTWAAGNYIAASNGYDTDAEAYTATSTDNTVGAALTALDSQVKTNADDIALKANDADLKTVAKTGAFADLTGKPTTLSGYGITDAVNASDVAGDVTIDGESTTSATTVMSTKAFQNSVGALLDAQNNWAALQGFNSGIRIGNTGGGVVLTQGTDGLKIGDNYALTDASTLNGANLSVGTVATVALANGAVTTDKLADNSVTSAKIVDGTIVNADIANGTITTAKLASQDVSQFNNDAGYQNATQVGSAITTALGSYSTTAQMNAAIADALDGDGTAGSAYQTGSQVGTTISNAIAAAAGTGLSESGGVLSVNTATTVADGNTSYVTSDLLFDQGYQNASQVNSAISGAITAAAGTGLSESGGVLSVNTATAVADGDTGYVTSDLLFDQGYQNATQVNSAITTALADYTTTADMNTALAGKTTLADVRTDAASTEDGTLGKYLSDNYATVADLAGKTTLADVRTDAASTEDGTLGKYLSDNYATVTDLAGKADSADLVTLQTAAAADATAKAATAETNAKSYADNVSSSKADNVVTADTDFIAFKNSDGSTEATTYTAAKIDALVSSMGIDQANAYTDARIERLDKDLSAGVAGAVALTSVAVSGVKKGEVSVGAGYGYFNGQSAAAFGAAMGLSKRWSVNAGAGVSSSDVSFRAGTNYKFKLF